MTKPHSSQAERPHLPPELLKHPGLTSDAPEIRTLGEELRPRVEVFFYKTRSPCLWVVTAGGTGTGKSTLFNLLCGRELSATGVERPKTSGPLAYAAAGCISHDDFPFPDMDIQRSRPGEFPPLPAAGLQGRLLLLEREGQEPSLVLVDTPDLDSVELENRRLARRLSIIADAVVFVTSGEKYADEVPSRFLLKLVNEGKPVYLAFNKAEPGLTPEEAAAVFEDHGISLKKERIQILPQAHGSRPQDDPALSSAVKSLEDLLSGLGRETLRREALSSESSLLKEDLSRLHTLLIQEKRASDRWSERLKGLLSETSSELIRSETERFAARHRSHISREIRRLFSRYDPLVRPRRAIKGLILTPLRILGLSKAEKEETKDLEKARQAAETAPVLAAVDRFNRRVLEELSPEDPDAPLFSALRSPEAAMERDEIESRLNREQELLESWVREKFEELRKGLPAAKKWSIYSTSILWGVLILAFEATVGGGFTVVDALVDSALAPFVTRGSAELFAHREIRAVAKEMASRYQAALLSILEEQCSRYQSIIESLTPDPTLEERLQALQKQLASWR
ncbi:MAG: GTPase [Desulfobacteraceae bacterium]